MQKKPLVHEQSTSIQKITNTKQNKNERKSIGCKVLSTHLSYDVSRVVSAHRLDRKEEVVGLASELDALVPALVSFADALATHGAVSGASHHRPATTSSSSSSTRAFFALAASPHPTRGAQVFYVEHIHGTHALHAQKRKTTRKKKE
jgi:hypothetical protein